MLWVKALHIIFVVTWFAGLFYLPRLFVYHSMSEDEIGVRRFEVMERRLLVIMTLGAIGAAIFGVWLLVGYAWQAYSDSVWLHAKLLLVLGLIAYHVYCGKLMIDLRRGRSTHGHVFYRWINELPTLALFIIVILSVVKPF